jgi:hypothetical protein
MRFVAYKNQNREDMFWSLCRSMYGFFGGRKQGHYNLIAREEEREMIPFCEDQGIAGRKDIKDSKRIFGVFFAF